jgi:hypothetical protein
MRIYEVYHEIAQENNIEFRIDSKEFSQENILHSTAPFIVDHYTFRKEINNTVVTLKNEFGNTNLAEAYCYIPNKPGLHTFQSKTINIFWTLFNKNKSRIQIITKNEHFKEIVEAMVRESGMDDISKDLNFEPSISFDLEQSKWKLKIQYSLQFSNKELAILPIFKFYEKFIQTFQ